MTDKKIYRYTNVELLDVIRNGRNQAWVENAKSEFEQRNLTNEDLKIAELEYEKYFKLKEKRKIEPLTKEEWFSFFFLPFFTTKPRWREDHFTDSEIERFRKNGFEKKYMQANKLRAFGYIFWFLVSLFAVIIYIELKR